MTKMFEEMAEFGFTLICFGTIAWFFDLQPITPKELIADGVLLAAVSYMLIGFYYYIKTKYIDHE